MRSVLFVFLVGCGGGSKSAPPPPAANQPSATPPMVAEPTRPTRPTCPDVNATCVMAMMEYFSKSMCVCKDKACADHTNEEMAAWGREAAKKPAAAKEETPSPEIARRASELMSSYTECMTKLMNGGTPPDPCEGRADPCGG